MAISLESSAASSLWTLQKRFPLAPSSYARTTVPTTVGRASSTNVSGSNTSTGSSAGRSEAEFSEVVVSEVSVCRRWRCEEGSGWIGATPDSDSKP